MKWDDLRVESSRDWPGEARTARVRDAVRAARDGWPEASRTVAEGNAYLAAWREAVLRSNQVLASLSSLVSSGAPFYSDRRVPASGPEADEFARTTWKGMPGATLPGMVEYGWRLTLAADYEDARGEWAVKLADFAAAAAAETAAASAELGRAVIALSEDVDTVAASLQVVASYTVLPEDVARGVEANLDRVRENRAAAVDVLRAVVDRLVWVERVVVAGDVAAFKRDEAARGLLPLAAVGVTLFALAKGG